MWFTVIFVLNATEIYAINTLKSISLLIMSKPLNNQFDTYIMILSQFYFYVFFSSSNFVSFLKPYLYCTVTYHIDPWLIILLHDLFTDYPNGALTPANSRSGIGMLLAFLATNVARRLIVVGAESEYCRQGDLKARREIGGVFVTSKEA